MIESNLVIVSKEELVKDFRNLKKLAEKMNLFETNFLFYLLHFLHIVFFDLLGWFLIYYSGYQNWYSYALAVVFLVTAQVNIHQQEYLSDFTHII
jgi:hypothetical protein